MNEFLSMSGYGAYVWSSIAIFIVVLGLDIAAPLIKRRGVLHELRARARRGRTRREENP